MNLKIIPNTKYALISNHMQHLSRRLQAFIREKGLTQAELAEAAHISQSAVSRIMHRTSRRHGRAFILLCKYAEINPDDADISAETPQKLIMNTFMKVWDGTDIHAETIARVIEALQDVRLQAVRPDRGRRKL